MEILNKIGIEITSALSNLDWYFVPLILLAGFVAGAINTVAGSGSVVTLSLLSSLGLPSNIANGTNRVGVLFQGIVGYRTYKNKSKSILGQDIAQDNKVILVASLGAILGTKIAVEVNEQFLNISIGLLMIVLLGLVLAKPKQWLKEQKTQGLFQGQSFKGLRYFIFFLIGIYGGYIQAGVGIFLLAALILGEGYTMVQANGMKLLIVLIYTIPALFLFIQAGHVNWVFGLLLAVGQMLGAWVAAILATRYQQANNWIRYLLIFILVASIFRFLGKGFL